MGSMIGSEFVSRVDEGLYHADARIHRPARVVITTRHRYCSLVMCPYVYLQFYLGIATVVQSVFTICVCVVVMSFDIRDKFVIMFSVTTSAVIC